MAASPVPCPSTKFCHNPSINFCVILPRNKHILLVEKNNLLVGCNKHEQVSDLNCVSRKRWSLLFYSFVNSHKNLKCEWSVWFRGITGALFKVNDSHWHVVGAVTHVYEPKHVGEMSAICQSLKKTPSNDLYMLPYISWLARLHMSISWRGNRST